MIDDEPFTCLTCGEVEVNHDQDDCDDCRRQHDQDQYWESRTDWERER